MKNTNRKVISIILVLLIAFGAAPIVSLPASAAESGDFSYILIQNGKEAEITKYNGTDENIVIPSAIAGKPVTSIGERAFYNCSSIKGVIISSDNMKIGNYAFYSCTSLTNITIPNGVTIIGDDAFSDCYSLKSITIPSSVIKVGDRAFADCSKLTNIIILSKNMKIGNYAFYYCTSLTNITIPKGVTNIGDCAFENCSSLTSVIVLDGVESIGNAAFAECKSLTNITISSSVTKIGDCAFVDCLSLKAICVDNANMNYSSDNNGVLFNKNKTILLQYPTGNTNTAYTAPTSVTVIGNSAFSNCSSFTSIVVPDNIIRIGDNAFSNCKSLKNFNIPSNVTSIGNKTFSNCSSLSSIVIPDKVTNIGNEAFFDCLRLASITIPDSVTSIGNNAFWGTSWYNKKSNGLVYAGKVAYRYKGEMPCYISITLLDGTKGIASNAFESYSLLTGIIIPSSVSNIGDNAFDHCKSLNGITIPNGVTSIGNDVFNNCTSLTRITIPSNVTSIGYEAFYQCASLSNITIPSSVTSIGKNAFFGTAWYDNNPQGLLVYAGKVAYKYKGAMTKGTSITLREGTKGIASGAFYNCSFLMNIIIPASVTNIGDEAFLGCTWLTNVTIPNSVTSIGNVAFSNCTLLEKIAIPDTVTSIGYAAFNNCKYLTIYCSNHSYAQSYAANQAIPFKTSCNITFDSSGGSAVATKTLTFGTKVTSIPTPTKKDYNFVGWYTAKSGGTKISFPYTAQTDLTFYAHWVICSYKITFNSGGGSAVSAKTLTCGTKVTSFPTPTKTGYKFVGWYSALSGGTKITFPYTVKANTTLYAHWTVNSYKITFNTNGGSAISAKTLTYGTKVTSFPSPTKRGYKFVGWYTAKSGGGKISFPYTVKGNVTIYAHWAKK